MVKKSVFWLNGIFCCVVMMLSSHTMGLPAPIYYFYDESCPKDSPFRESISDSCYSCDTPKALMMRNSADCAKCSNREMSKNNDFELYCRLKTCPKNKPFYEEKWNWSGCKGCTDQPTFITKEECQQCSNMYWIDMMHLCAPKKDSGFYYDGQIKDDAGTVSNMVGGFPPYFISCEKEIKNTYVRGYHTMTTECEKCPNTYMQDGYCYFQKEGINGRK